MNDVDLINIAKEVYAGYCEADLGNGVIKNASASMEKEKAEGSEQLYFIDKEIIYSLRMDEKNLT